MGPSWGPDATDTSSSRAASYTLHNFMNVSGALPEPVAAVLQARQAATSNEIGVAIARKHLDTQKQAGEAINQILEATVTTAKQISAGHLDVRV